MNALLQSDRTARQLILAPLKSSSSVSSLSDRLQTAIAQNFDSLDRFSNERSGDQDLACHEEYLARQFHYIAELHLRRFLTAKNSGDFDDKEMCLASLKLSLSQNKVGISDMEKEASLFRLNQCRILLQILSEQELTLATFSLEKLLCGKIPRVVLDEYTVASLARFTLLSSLLFGTRDYRLEALRTLFPSLPHSFPWIYATRNNLTVLQLTLADVESFVLLMIIQSRFKLPSSYEAIAFQPTERQCHFWKSILRLHSPMFSEIAKFEEDDSMFVCMSKQDLSRCIKEIRGTSRHPLLKQLYLACAFSYYEMYKQLKIDKSSEAAHYFSIAKECKESPSSSSEPPFLLEPLHSERMLPTEYSFETCMRVLADDEACSYSHHYSRSSPVKQQHECALEEFKENREKANVSARTTRLLKQLELLHPGQVAAAAASVPDLPLKLQTPVKQPEKLATNLSKLPVPSSRLSRQLAQLEALKVSKA